jgi:hypothetical protein
MIHWSITLLLCALAGLIGVALGRHRGRQEGYASGHSAGHAAGVRDGLSSQWAARVRVWADKED